jgi:hypothetical protein
MKIRIKSNSVRFRLSKSEVASLVANGYLEEKTEFESNTLKYIVTVTDASNMSIDFSNGNINLLAPQKLVQKWSSSNMISLEQMMPLKNEVQLHILLEKDFKCIDAIASEDQSDYFENPGKSC